jgi:hypothetical protein
MTRSGNSFARSAIFDRQTSDEIEAGLGDNIAARTSNRLMVASSNPA